jgi:hypothetical protein
MFNIEAAIIIIDTSILILQLQDGLFVLTWSVFSNK